MNKIEEFRGPTRWLSNFEASEITMPDGITYPTVEHAYQAYKTLDLRVRETMATLATPRHAKRAGNTLEDMRSDWEYVKLHVMEGITDSNLSDAG